MRTYEVLFILSPQLAEQDATNLIADFRGIAEKSGATLASEESWGRRRLAYPIKKMQEGIYHLFVFTSEEDLLGEVDRKMKNSDQVLRHMIVRTDQQQKRAVKLAKKYPKKERIRPQPPQLSQSPPPQQSPPQPAPPPIETPAAPPVEAAPAEGTPVAE
jgi:small subunit ribosomal protein S6